MRMRTVGLGTHSGGSWLAMSRVEDAWNDYDVASTMARRYKRLSKALFLVQLLISGVVVLLGTVSVISDDLECGIRSHSIL